MCREVGMRERDLVWRQIYVILRIKWPIMIKNWVGEVGFRVRG